MKNCIFLIAIVLLVLKNATGQANVKDTTRGNGRSNTVSLDPWLPLGVFARSHIAGAGLEYAWSDHRFGSEAKPKKWVGLTFNAGADYYIGKKIETAGYPFQYDDYIYLYLVAGLITNPFAGAYISLAGGPALGIYSGNTYFGGIVSLSGSYFIKPRFAIGPAFTYRKHEESDALWALGCKASYSF